MKKKRYRTMDGLMDTFNLIFANPSSQKATWIAALTEMKANFALEATNPTLAQMVDRTNVWRSLYQNELVPFFYVAFIFYLPFIFLLQKVKLPKTAKYDTAYNLWNLGLCIFSFWGVYRCVPVLIATIASKGVVGAILTTEVNEWCTTPIVFFGFSIVAELGDTVFVLLRGRKLIFLQYYHHWITMIYCYHSFQHTVPFNGTCAIFTR